MKDVSEVSRWRMCTSCGSCAVACPRGALELVDFEDDGIRPVIAESSCNGCSLCVAVCPGYMVNANLVEKHETSTYDHLFGNVLEAFEGWATSWEIRRKASSGGVITALALWAIEKGKAKAVLHIGMDPKAPYRVLPCKSRTREQIISRAGSRYAPSSTCKTLAEIQDKEGPFLFVGKPCDVAGLRLLEDRGIVPPGKVSLAISFFCAGTPSTSATLRFLRNFNLDPKELKGLWYRGEGWPGDFRAAVAGQKINLASYEETWSFLQKSRPLRCHLCPDGTGELADISCGDAWHLYKGKEQGGFSVVLARTEKGSKWLKEAEKDKYLVLRNTTLEEIKRGQGLTERRREVFGRLLVFRFLGIPSPRFKGFKLLSAWWTLPLARKLRTILGTLRRVFLRKLFLPRKNLFRKLEKDTKKSKEVSTEAFH